MGTITPNSTVYLLTGVPLDNTYENTIYFASTALQLAHFLNTGQSPFWDYQPRQITPLSYQRVNEGVLRVNLPYDQIYNCNYMMFQNTSFGDKWSYAFITNVEYVNNTIYHYQFRLCYNRNIINCRRYIFYNSKRYLSCTLIFYYYFIIIYSFCVYISIC